MQAPAPGPSPAGGAVRIDASPARGKRKQPSRTGTRSAANRPGVCANKRRAAWPAAAQQAAAQLAGLAARLCGSIQNRPAQQAHGNGHAVRDAPDHGSADEEVGGPCDRTLEPRTDAMGTLCTGAASGGSGASGWGTGNDVPREAACPRARAGASTFPGPKQQASAHGAQSAAARARRSLAPRWTSWWARLVTLLVDSARHMMQGRHVTFAQLSDRMMQMYPHDFGQHAHRYVTCNIRSRVKMLVETGTLAFCRGKKNAYAVSITHAGLEHLLVLM
jgi:hypothetical protein